MDPYIAPGVQPSTPCTPVITSVTVSLNGYLNLISYFALRLDCTSREGSDDSGHAGSAS